VGEIGSIVLASYDLTEFQESLLPRDIASEEAASLVKSILLEKGLSADSSIEAFELRGKIMSKELVMKRKVWWEPVPGATSYVVYLSEDIAIFEPDNFFGRQPQDNFKTGYWEDGTDPPR